MRKYKIADLVFTLNCIYSFTPKLCANYEYFGETLPETEISITNEDIEKEVSLSVERPKEYLECIAVYRKICEYIFKHKNGMLIHSSAVVYNGKAYLFSAPSGTGKSTHASLWLKLLGDKAYVINDDKPIIRLIDGKFYVYGTPWSGKHKKDVNTRAEISAICFINQAKEDTIRVASVKEIFPLLLNQTVRFSEITETDKLFGLIEKLLTSVKLFRLSCTPNLSAAELAVRVMTGEYNES